MRLIPNWKRLHRMASMRAMALAGAVQTTWELLPPDLKTSVPPKYVYLITMALLVFGMVGRLIDQPKAMEPK
jgi:hypothetical protein